MPENQNQPRVCALYRYPVKGLSPEALTQTVLTAGETVPFDRAYAIENGPGRFDPAAPRHLPKTNFLMLMRDERLATLETRLDTTTQVLTVRRAGRQVARGDLKSRLGRQLIEQFLAAYMKAELRGAPRIVEAAGHSFSDVAAKCLHIVNLDSVAEIARVIGKPVDPLRFRANVYLEGLQPWAEFGWLGKHIGVSGAEGAPVALKVFKRTQRCAATNVDPASGVRDLAIPAELSRTWGHSDMGIYAMVAAGGTIAVGDALTVPG